MDMRPEFLISREMRMTFRMFCRNCEQQATRNGKAGRHRSNQTHEECRTIGHILSDANIRHKIELLEEKIAADKEQKNCPYFQILAATRTARRSGPRENPILFHANGLLYFFNPRCTLPAEFQTTIMV